MVGSRRSFAIALITAVVIGGSCAAPSIRNNDISFVLGDDGEDPVTVFPKEIDEPRRYNQDTALQLKSDSKTSVSTTRNDVGYNSDEMEEPESSNSQPQSAITMTTRAPQQSSTTANQLDSSAEESHSSTTEHPHNVLGKIFSKPQDKPGRIFFAGGVHNYRVGNDEDERKRAVEEYKYHFVRVEQGLPHTTKRGDRFRAP